MLKFRSILATLYLFFHPGTWKELREGMNTPVSDCVSWKDVPW